jgi:ribosomal protein S18 acetylase RimI-like enzyme
LSIVETRDKQLLRRIFARDPIGTIYMIGDLDDRHFPHCRWFVNGERGVLLLYEGLAVPMVVYWGEVDTLVREVPLPARFYTKIAEPDRPLFGAWQLTAPDELYVMGLESLAPPEPVPNLTMKRIEDAGVIEAVYRDYPGNYFTAAQVPLGLYVAAELNGEIVAAAGTHACAPEEGAAAIGNVVTSRAHRGRGIASSLVAFLCAELSAGGCRHVGLHVNRSNCPAIASYRRIGFTVHSEITQWTATLR